MRVAVLIVALCGALFVAMPVLGDEEEEAGRMPGDEVTEPEPAEAPPVEAKGKPASPLRPSCLTWECEEIASVNSELCPRHLEKSRAGAPCAWNPGYGRGPCEALRVEGSLYCSEHGGPEPAKGHERPSCILDGCGADRMTGSIHCAEHTG